MVRTKKYYIYQIWEMIRANIGDDDSLDERLIGAWVDDAADMWKANEINKNNWLNPSLIQNVNNGAVELETIDSGAISLAVGTAIKRTTIDIPSPLTLHRKLAFSRIGPVDKVTSNFKVVDELQIPNIGNGRFNRDAIYAFYYDKRVYLYCNNTEFINYKLLKNVNIRGVFANPEEVPGYDENGEYPMSGAMFAYISSYIMEKKYKIIINAKSDEINNARED